MKGEDTRGSHGERVQGGGLAVVAVGRTEHTDSVRSVSDA